MTMGNNDLDKSAEELSALVDGEVSELELRRVLKNIEQDQALCQKWSRYQLASAVLRRQTGGQSMAWLDVDLSARVQQALEQEPAPVSARTGRNPISNLFGKPLANVAVAASVSAAVILGWQNLASGPGVQTVPAVAASTPVVMTPVAGGNGSPIMNVSQTNGVAVAGRAMQPEMIRYNPELDDRLNYYLLSHSSNAAVNTANSVTPYARVVTIKPSAEGASRTQAGQ